MTSTNAVITSLLTSQPDPQRGIKWNPDTSVLNSWSISIHGARRVVLVDEVIDTSTSLELVNVAPLEKSPYFARWYHSLEYLKSVDDELVWMTDGSDVVMLRTPWPDMQPDTLYVGSEEETVGFWWMKEAHQDPNALAWIYQHSDLPLLNAGLVGGDRKTVIDFLTDLCETLDAHPDDSDMAVFNMVAHGRPHVTGPQVHTKFKSYTDNGTAWWMHK